MQEKSKEPEIRFVGFTGAWEQRKIGDYLTLSKIPGHTGVDAKKLTVKLWGKGVVEKTDIYGGSQNTQYYVRRAGQFMYGKLDFLHAAFGIVPKSLDRFESTLDSPAFDLHEIDGAFLQNRVTQQNFYLKFGNIANGSRKAKRIHEVTFLDMPIVVPSYAEQKKIGAFLNKLDSLLTLHQRKYEKLLNIKKSMLEKMFPKEGEVVPEIRFKGFTGAWEQRKLSDGMTEYTDRVFIEDDQIYKQVTVKNTGEISLRGSQPGRNIGRKRQARVNLRDYPMTLIFTRQTVEQGGIGFAKNDVDGCIVTENMPTIAVDGKKFNQDFLVAFFKTYGFRKDVILSNIEGGTAQIAIHEDDILDSSSTFPSLKEQIKIGNFFRTLSQQITLHQRKLEMLKNVKQAFLEKMFV